MAVNKDIYHKRSNTQALYVGATRSAAANVTGILRNHRLGPFRHSLLPGVINQSINQLNGSKKDGRIPIEQM